MRRIMFVIFSCLLLLPSASLAAIQDVTAPTLEEVVPIDTEIHAGERINVKLKVSDNLSGVSSIYVRFYSPTKKHYVTGSLAYNAQPVNGYYTVTTEAVNSYAEIGDWYLEYISITDNANNSLDIHYGYDFSYQQTPLLKVKVISSELDVTAPALEEVVVKQEQLSVGERIQIKVKATDDLSGIGSIYVRFYSPTKKHYVTGSLPYNASPTNGYYTIVTDAINSYAEAGEWYLEYMSITDKSNNSLDLHYGYEYSYQEQPIAKITVINSNEDLIKPVLEEVIMVDQGIQLGERIQLKVKARDDLSEVSSIYVRFYSPTKKHYVTGSLPYNASPTDGYYTIVTDAINSYAEQGEWYLEYISVTDSANNSLDIHYGYDYSYQQEPIAKILVDDEPFVELPSVIEQNIFEEWPTKSNVPLNKEWTIDFSLNFDIKTILDDNIYVTDSQNNKIPMLFIVDRTNFLSSSLIITPLTEYKKNETYTLWVKDILSVDGKSLTKNVKMAFKTVK